MAVGRIAKEKMHCKRWLSWLLVVCLCVGLIPMHALHTQASTGEGETLPTGFTQVTPKDFGISDIENNDGTKYQDGVKPIDSVHGVVLKADVVFGRRAMYYLYNGVTTGGIHILGRENLHVYNYVSPSAGMYIGGSFVDGNYVGGELLSARGDYYIIKASAFSSTEDFDTLEFSFAITTEFVDFDGGGTADDLKVGFWINDTLYNNTYVYMRNSLGHFTPYLAMTVDSMSSPGYTAPVFPEVSFDTCGVDEKLYENKGLDLAVSKNAPESFANKTFVGTVHYSDTSKSYLNLGGASSGWEGIQLVTLKDNTLYLTEAYGAFTSIPIEGSWTGKDIRIKISFEVLNLDGGDEADDVRIWLYLNDELYNQAPIVDLTNYASKLGTHIGIYCDNENATLRVLPNAKSVMQTMPEGYRIVTPLALDVTDTIKTDDGFYMETPADKIEKISIDKLLFSASVKYDSSALLCTIDYLYNPTTESGIRLQFHPTGYSGLYLYNYMTSGELYAGDASNATAYGSPYYINKTIANVENNDFYNSEFLLWITTEFMDFDGVGGENDLQLGIWFDGVLYNDMYFYVANCKDIDYYGKVKGDCLQSLSSPLLTPADLEVAPGEYVSAAGECYTADKVKDKEMNGTTFYSQIRFEGVGATLYYGCQTLDKEKAIKLTVDEEGLLISNTHGMGEEILGRLDVTGTFELELSTEYVDSDKDGDVDDVRLMVSVDGKARYYYLKDVAGLMTATVRMISDEQSSILIGEFADTEPQEQTWCLDEDVAYELTKTENATSFTVDGAQYKEKAVLSMPGTYSVAEVKDGQIYMQDVTVYRNYDVNLNNKIDVVDLIKTLKLAEESTRQDALASTNKAGLLAVGYDETTWTKDVADEALGSIREGIVTAPTTECVTMDKMDTQEEVYTYGFEFLGGTDVMPIGGFNGPGEIDTSVQDYVMPTFMSDKYFSLIQESGVNLITYSPVFYDTSPYAAIDMLELGEKYGVGITVNDRRYFQEGTALTEEQAEAYLSEYRDYKAFCGIHGVDEPETDDFYVGEDNNKPISYYQTAINILEKLNVWSFGNLLACNAAGNRAKYDTYVETWLNSCDMKMLMWDHYVHDIGVSEKDYFYSLSYGREKATEHQIPFWTFIQAGSQWRTSDSEAQDSNGYYPNKGEFLWNVNTSLAYGAKGISYFPLIQPTYFAVAESTPYDFERNGMIGASGNLNRWWYYAQTANKQIAAVDEVLMNSVSKGVIVTSEQAKADNADSTCIIEGTAWRELTNITGDVMVGCFNYQGKSAFYVVNYDMEYAQNINLEFSENYKFEVIQNAVTSDFEANHLNLNIKAGEGVLVVMK